MLRYLHNDGFLSINRFIGPPISARYSTPALCAVFVHDAFLEVTNLIGWNRLIHRAVFWHVTMMGRYVT